MKSTKISSIIATGFGSGLSPVSPGTVGSLFALLLWYGVTTLSPHFWAYLPLVCILVFIIGLIASHFEIQNGDDDDPQHIVIDEWIGMLISLLMVDQTKPLHGALAFLAFRLFDIIKPGPVSWLESLPGALGVMLDDVAAGGCVCGLWWILNVYVF